MPDLSRYKGFAAYTFGAGILVASLGAAKPPSAPSQWPDTWPLFLGGTLLAAFSILVWRIAAAQARRALAEDLGTKEGNPFVLLSSVQAPLATLQAQAHTLDTRALCEQVDAILVGYILPFVEVRRQMLDRLGMNAGSEIISLFAYGERMLNRVWSASADGHLPEALDVLPDAILAFADAHRLAQAALATS